MDREAEIDSDRVLPWDLMGGGQDGYDAAFYEERFLRAVEAVLTPLGITAKMLRDGVTKLLPMPALQKNHHCQSFIPS